ncbi:hypothetical protein ACOMHN_031884 [Nucella lapillus]
MAQDMDTTYFKNLLALVPSQFCFIEEKHVTQTTEDQNQTETGGNDKQSKKRKHKEAFKAQTPSLGQDADSARDEKIRGKKESKQKKKKKENAGPKINIQEAQERLRARIAELQAKRAQNHLTTAEMQEQKRLDRKQRKLKTKGKQKNKKGAEKHKGAEEPIKEQVPIRKPSKPIINKEGKLVFSRFDFSHSGGKEAKSELVGKDYKRILARLEQRDAKVAKLKETDSEAASKLEQKFVWQDVLTKARGEKIKDDVSKVKKAIKRKEKMKEQRQDKWKGRKATEDKMQTQRQEKRQGNLQKRKDEKKAKHRKKLIKKGRILPGF